MAENLEQLTLFYVIPVDVEALGNLTNLREISVIDGIEQRHLQGLSEDQVNYVLENYYNQVSFDVEDLALVKSLEILQLHFLFIKNWSNIESLNNLMVLNVTQARLDNVIPITTLNDLEILGLAGNYIQDLSPLGQNPGLDAGDKIDLSGNCLDLSPDSEASRIIAVLEARGVSISTQNQRPENECEK